MLDKKDINIKPSIFLKINKYPLSEYQINILKLIDKTKSQNKTAKLLNVPPSTVNIIISRMEGKLGFKLVESSKVGTVLTDTGKYILEHYDTILKKIRSENYFGCGYISGEIGKILFENIIISSFDNILSLSNKGLLSIMGVDDPLWGFKYENAIPVVYDNLLFVYYDELNFNNLIGIRYSSQRIMWNILKNENIQYKITKIVRNPFYALDLLYEGYTLVINESFKKYFDRKFKVKKLYYDKTKHTINFVIIDSYYENILIDTIVKKKKYLKSRGFRLVEFLD